METWGLLVLSLTPYCVDLEAIQNGVANAFSTPPSPDYAPILMDPSQANVYPVYYVVSCDPSWLGTYYFIDLDDENMAISPAPALKMHIQQALYLTVQRVTDKESKHRTAMSRLVFKAPTEVVKLSCWAFTVWWIIILGVHVVTCVYTALYSYTY
ncbi:hypothetical protein L917_00311 [Phytophthora nicotianae]|uniref:Uncharacterized protein n=1 Tax=Phytophthora nicotianae TaxID=4792 RepID=W2M152_PHYNI|nr:hypothetical protein L917_00311 [Phytophthora nicotianae]